MRGFEPVTFAWEGKQFTVPADEQLMLIARIEDALAGAAGDQAIEVLLRRNGPPYARLAGAYGAALRYAGADVSDADVYLTIMRDLGAGSGDAAGRIQGAVLALLAVISPPMAEALSAPSEGDVPGKAEPAAD